MKVNNVFNEGKYNLNVGILCMNKSKTINFCYHDQIIYPQLFMTVVFII